MSEEYSRYLDVAIRAAKAAEDVIARYYRTDIDVTRKADASPVTVADVECEQVIKQVLGEAFPEHGFYGEELGRESIDADYVWLIDPIDGTKSFVRGYPMFSTQIALMHAGELVVGVSNAPMYNGGELMAAAKGAGATMDGQPIAVSAIETISEASLSLGNIGALGVSPAWGDIGRLVGDVHRIRGYGDFLHYHLLASGAIDMVIESDLNILDIAALAVIIREAGGDVTTLDGRPLDLESRTLLATNARLREPVNAYLTDWDDTRDGPQG